MGFPGSQFRHGPCPVCGASDGAFKGRSTWSYGGLVCSDKCGEAASAAIDQVCESAPYKAALEQKWTAEETLARLKSEAVKTLHRS